MQESSTKRLKSSAAATTPSRSAAPKTQEAPVSTGRLLLCGALILVSVIAAWLQEPRDDPFAPPTWYEWLTKPLEVNAPLRLPTIDGALGCVDVSADGRHITIGGAGGEILRSSDNGLTWSRTTLEFPRYTTPAAPAQVPPRAAPVRPAPTLEPPAKTSSMPTLERHESLPESMLPHSDQGPRFLNASNSQVAQNAPLDKGAGTVTKSESSADSHFQVVPMRMKLIDGTRGVLVANVEEYTPSGGNSGGGAATYRNSPYTAAYYTENGVNWRQSILPREVEEYSLGTIDLFVFEGQIFFANGWKLLHSSDNGKSFQFLDDWETTLDTPPPAAPVPAKATSFRTTFAAQYSGIQWPVFFTDQFNGFTLGKDHYSAFLARTNNGGRTWSKSLIEVDETSFAAGEFVQLLERSKGTESWALFLPTDESEWRLARLSGSKLLPGRSAIPTRLDTALGRRLVARGEETWLLPDLLKIGAGSETWTPSHDGTDDRLIATDLGFAERQDAQGWIVGEVGRVYQTTDGGSSWRRRALTSLEAASDQYLTGYWRFPSLWFYLVLATSVVLVWWRPASSSSVESASAPMGVGEGMGSDRPIQRPEEDRLDFTPVALGLSRFLRNRNTEPPLTIAVCGAWGSGKSSIMQIMQSDLQSVGFPTVWFNAWHHRQEASILAALLEGVKAFTTPPVLSRDGVKVRWWLFKRRVAERTNWFIILGALFMAAVVLGYWTTHRTFLSDFLSGSDVREAPVSAPLRMLHEPLNALITDNSNLPSDPESTSSTSTTTIIPIVLVPEAEQAESIQPKEWWSVLLSMVGLGPLVLVLRSGLKYLKVFDVHPIDLLSNAVRTPKRSDLQAQTEFRAAFARDFHDVAETLDVVLQRRVTIFIDDLDRCQPAHVVEVLEAVNFLVSSGKCFIVLGMSKNEVMHYVGLHFKEVAEAMAHTSGAISEQEAQAVSERYKHQLDFAGRYLEKLINIEVPVPKAKHEQLLAMVTGAVNPEPIVLSKSARRKANKRRRAAERKVESVRRWRLGLTWGRGLATALCLIAGVYGCYLYGSGLRPPSNRGYDALMNQLTAISNQLTSLPIVRPESGSDAPVPDGVAPESAPRPNIIFGPRTPVPVAYQAAPVSSYMDKKYVLLWFALTLLAVAPILLMAPPPYPEVRDSGDFARALEIWAPVIQMNRSSPRSYKRLVNRMRFYAMRMRPIQAVAATPLPAWSWNPRTWGSFRRALQEELSGRRAYEVGSPELKEEQLVAVAVLADAEPEQFSSDKLWAKLMANLSKTPAVRDTPLMQAMRSAVRRHREAFKSWPPEERYRKLVLSVSSELNHHS